MSGFAIIGAGFGGWARLRLCSKARRLRHLRARRGRGRDVARQHLSGLRLRRGVAPLLILLRAEPRLDGKFLAPARNLGLPAPLRARLRRAPAHPIQSRSPRRRVGRIFKTLAHRDLARELHGRRARDGVGRFERAFAAGVARPLRVPRQGVPLGTLGSRVRLNVAPRGGRRHGRVGRPVVPEIKPRRTADVRTSAAAVGAAAARPRALSPAKRQFYRRFPVAHAYRCAARSSVRELFSSTQSHWLAPSRTRRPLIT